MYKVYFNIAHRFCYKLIAPKLKHREKRAIIQSVFKTMSLLLEDNFGHKIDESILWNRKPEGKNVLITIMVKISRSVVEPEQKWNNSPTKQYHVTKQCFISINIWQQFWRCFSTIYFFLVFWFKDIGIWLASCGLQVIVFIRFMSYTGWNQQEHNVFFFETKSIKHWLTHSVCVGYPFKLNNIMAFVGYT